jgi:hypothetical protein
MDPSNRLQTNLLRVFNRLFGAEQFTDVVLAAQGRTVRAHKVRFFYIGTYLR